MTRIIDSFAEIAGGYDALFCDLWGCVHDGERALPAAVAALEAFKARGGTVVLVSNAPRPRADVAAQIGRLGVPEDCWDIIATSGDSARAAMFEGAVGHRVYHIGGAEDESFFAPMRIAPDFRIDRVPLDRAEGIVCTGLADPLAGVESYRGDLLRAKQSGLKLLCANPDIVVDRGPVREWCAGAVARAYTEMGGTAFQFGKPHPPIYDLARRRLAEVDARADARILAVGDGIATDIAGAMGEDIDSLFVTGGLAARETETGAHPDAAALTAYLRAEQARPDYAIGYLR